MLDLTKRGRDVRCFVNTVEGWLIDALCLLGVTAYRAPGRVGIWTDDPGLGEAKLGAIGIRIRRWVSLHGFSVNIDPDLCHFDGVVPCGIADYGVTSLARLGANIGQSAFDDALLSTLPDNFRT